MFNKPIEQLKNQKIRAMNNGKISGRIGLKQLKHEFSKKNVLRRQTLIGLQFLARKFGFESIDVLYLKSSKKY